MLSRKLIFTLSASVAVGLNFYDHYGANHKVLPGETLELDLLEDVTLTKQQLLSYYTERYGDLGLSVEFQGADIAGALDGIEAGDAEPNKILLAGPENFLDMLYLGNLKFASGTPVNAVQAKATLTFSGVVVDEETVSIGDDTYEFVAKSSLAPTEGNLAVDITAHTTAAQGTLTVAEQPTALDTFTIGDDVYTFVTTDTADEAGEINIGETLEATQANIIAAINGTDGINTASGVVEAGDFTTNASVLTALIGGTAANLISLTETFTSESNVFDGETLGTTTAGVDCTATNAVADLVAAVNLNDTVGVTASSDGDTVIVTADTAGVIGNVITVTENLTNAEFDEETLVGGVDGTVTESTGILFADESYVYYAIAPNTIADKNWRRIALGSAY